MRMVTCATLRKVLSIVEEVECEVGLRFPGSEASTPVKIISVSCEGAGSIGRMSTCVWHTELVQIETATALKA